MKQLLLFLSFVLYLSSCGNCGSNCPCKIKESILFDHMALKCKDVKVSAAWYQKVFETVEIENKTGNQAITWVSLGDAELHLTPFRDTLPVVPHKSHHIAIANHDIVGLTARLDAMGVTWESWSGTQHKIASRPDGVKQIYFQDPDGYWIEVNDAGFSE